MSYCDSHTDDSLSVSVTKPTTYVDSKHQVLEEMYGTARFKIRIFSID